MIEGEGNGWTDFVVCLRPERPAGQLQDGDGRLAGAENEETIPIGKAGVWRDNEIGFILLREHWGRGYAKEAVSVLLDHLFSDPGGDIGQGKRKLPLEEIVADVDPRNEGSLALLRRMWFVKYAYQERSMQVGEEWVDSVYLTLRRDIWRVDG